MPSCVICVTQELAPYHTSDGKRVVIEGPGVVLEPNAAQAIAVIFHELATNAVKYGALSVDGGRISIAWTRSENGSEKGSLVLRWTETGGPIVTAPSREGVGGRVMKAMIGQAHGEMRVDWHPAGIACEMVIPV